MDDDASQIAQLIMIPVSCSFEDLFNKIHYLMDTKLSITIVLLGMAVCIVSDVSVDANDIIGMGIVVWCTAQHTVVE